MTTMRTFSEVTAHKIFDMLVTLCGKREDQWDRDQFVWALQRYLDDQGITGEGQIIRGGNHRGFPFEYRFGGGLGTGGKFYHSSFRGFSVGCYPEALPQSHSMRDEMNQWLQQQGWQKCPMTAAFLA